MEKEKKKIINEEHKVEHKEVKLNIRNINETVTLAKRLLKLLYIIIIFIGIYSVIQICNALQILPFILSILSILFPLFLGLLIAWLFYPLVKKLETKGIRRVLATSIIYVALVAIIVLIIFTLIPLLYNQIMDLVSQLPGIGSSIQNWISNFFNKFKGVPGLDIEATKLSVLDKIGEVGRNLTNSLPMVIVNTVSSVFAGLGKFCLGLIIGFFVLVGIDNPMEVVKDFLPEKFHDHTIGILTSINNSCRNFINGALIDCFVVFIISTIALWLVGLKSPILFGLFCGITNIIPYAGPYIGGAPAIIVGFSQSPLTGILALVAIALIQAIEGNLFQPMIMSKTTKLHPVTIILGLLIFGHFWGMIGMIIATPLLAAIKSVIMYFDEKYNILDFNN